MNRVVNEKNKKW